MCECVCVEREPDRVRAASNNDVCKHDEALALEDAVQCKLPFGHYLQCQLFYHKHLSIYMSCPYVQCFIRSSSCLYIFIWDYNCFCVLEEHKPFKGAL